MKQDDVYLYFVQGVIRGECLLVGVELSKEDESVHFERVFLDSLISSVHRIADTRVQVKSVLLVAYRSVENL